MTSRLLLRVALRLQHAWSEAHRQPTFDEPIILDRMTRHIEVVRNASANLAKADRLRLTLIAPQLRQAVNCALRSLSTAVSQSQLDERNQVEVPGLDACLAELRQIADDFPETTFDLKSRVIAAATEPIILEETDLGPFTIEFHWDRLRRSRGISCFEIVALRPNPAASNSEVTHPHVRDGALCAGDAADSIAAAVAQGRLADAFMLIRGVLGNYNSSSPFVSLSEWDGTNCQDCGVSVSSDDRYCCARCDGDYCDGCTGICARCQDCNCLSCLTECAVCDERICLSCRVLSANSSRDCCPDCVKPCAGCEVEFAADELDDDNTLCPSCISENANQNDTHDADPDPSLESSPASTKEST